MPCLLSLTQHIINVHSNHRHHHLILPDDHHDLDTDHHAHPTAVTANKLRHPRRPIACNCNQLSRENLVDSPEVTLSADQCDDRFLQLPEGIDLALHRTKLWSKYAKDLMAYIEKRAHLEAEYARNLAKLAHATKPLLKEEVLTH